VREALPLVPKFTRSLPIARLGTPEEVATAIAFLASSGRIRVGQQPGNHRR
jgi:NAD(P)-dependent dehydrogenase (short-subunit alcohol dehydrogenase family)